MFNLGKMSLIITTRCNLRCKLCCEYIAQYKPFPDMTLDEERRILAAFFEICDHVETLHLTGGGEPFLHKQLAEMVEIAMEYSERFDRLMLFTNCTVPLAPQTLDTFKLCKEKLFIQLSRYGIKPDMEEEFVQAVLDAGIPNRIRKYYGDDQSFGGWVSFGDWNKQDKTADELAERFTKCAVTRVLHGNWRTRDGKVHWCSRSQRGMELGLIPNDNDDYVDLFDGTSAEEKRVMFERIAKKKYLSTCDYCSGDQGTENTALRFPAAEQLKINDKTENAL
jgi:hypothetical protein